MIAPWDGGMGGRLNSNFKVVLNGDKVEVVGNLDLHNQYIQQLIDQQDATFWLEIDCKNTKYHKEISLDSNQFKYLINVGALDGRVDFFPSVVVKATIPDFKDNSFENDYQGISFTVYKGDYIAIGEPFEFNVNIDHYGKPKSIFGVHPDKDVDKADIVFEANKDKIWIHVAPEVATKLTPLIEQTAQVNEIIRTLVLVPALHEAFTTIPEVINDESRSIDDYRWVDSLDEKLRKIGADYQNLDLNLYDEYARKILNISFDEVVSSLGKFTSGEGESDE